MWETWETLCVPQRRGKRPKIIWISHQLSNRKEEEEEEEDFYVRKGDRRPRIYLMF